MAPDEHRIIYRAADVVHEHFRPGLLVSCAHESGVKHAAVKRAHVEFADNYRLAEIIEKAPLARFHSRPVDVEAHDIAEFRAGFNALLRVPRESRTQIEMVGIIFLEGIADRTKILTRECLDKYPQIFAHTVDRVVAGQEWLI